MGRGRGPPPRQGHPGGKLKEDRYAEGVSDAFKEKIKLNNGDFYKGIKLVEHYDLIDASGNKSPWEKVESLSKRYPYYYHNRKTGKTTKNPGDEVLNYTEDFRDYEAVQYRNPQRPNFNPCGNRVIDVMFNSFRVTNFDEIRSWCIYIYTIDFTPQVPAKGNADLRRRIFFGPNRRETQKYLYKELGHWEFNNQVLVVLSNRQPPSPLEWKSGEHTVRCCCVSKGSLEDFDDDEVRSNFLSVLTRRKMDDADYVRLSRDAGTYFPRSHLGDFVPIRSDKYHALLGYDAKVSYTNSNDVVITVDVRVKCIEQKSMHENIDWIMRKNRQGDNWKRLVKRTYEGKHAMVSYNKQTFRIDEVDTESNHNTEIPDMKTRETYKSYLKTAYNESSPKNEVCILKSIDKKTGKVCGFLPQHCYIVFQNDDDRVQDALKDLAKEKLEYRFPRIQGFVQDINTSRAAVKKRQKDWKGLPTYQFKNNFEYGKAILLPQPGIRFKCGQRGEKPAIKDFPYIYDEENNQKIGAQWRYSKGPMKPKKMKSWVVIIPEMCKGYKVKGRGKPQSIQEHILSELESYRKSRSLASDCLPNPTFKEVKISQSNVHKLIKYQRCVDKFDEVVLGILPEGEMQSQVKQEMTRAFTLTSSKRPRATQFCNVEHLNNVKFFMKTVFDMILLKKGNKMYELLPALSPNSMFNPRGGNMWFIGVAIDVNPDNNHWPIASVTLISDPLAGAQNVVFPVCHFQSEKNRIIPYDVMREMIVNVVDRAYKANRKLPSQIVVFRDGIGEGSFPELYSKEITAIKKSITVDCAQKLGVDWKPTFCVLTCQKGILNRVTIPGRKKGQYFDPKSPLLVFQGPLSRKHWDFLLQVVTDRRGGAKPVKYVILYENMGLKKKPENIIDLFNLIHCTHYGFATSVPFQNGAASIPSPVKYALHHANLMHESVRECDLTPSELSAHKKLVNRCQVLDWDEPKENAV